MEVDAAVGRLTMTMPASELRLKWVACFRLVVAMPEDRPKLVSLATARMTAATGPKISSRAIRIWFVAYVNSAGCK